MKNYNQFILLIYNLVFADMQQSIAFALTSRWLHVDKVQGGTAFCFAEGWLVSVGDLANSVWIFAIAIHTFLAVIEDYKVSFSTFITITSLLWVFIYGLAIVGVAIHPHDIYARAGAWVSGHCFNQKHTDMLLVYDQWALSRSSLVSSLHVDLLLHVRHNLSLFSHVHHPTATIYV